MSQASKHVAWCLNKAKKEIEECTRLGKHPKHRGLVHMLPSDDEARNHLKKAEENLRFATSWSSKEYGYKIVEASFYCMYQCFLSIASKFGYESGNQSCTVGLIEYLKEENKINIDEKFIQMMKYPDEQTGKQYKSVIEMREDYTYSAKISVEQEQIDELILICKELMEKTKKIIFSLGA